MFRDLKEYQNLQKLYEEKVSKPVNLVEKPNMPGSGVKSNVEVKSREEVGLKNNIKLNNNKKINTDFDSSKIIKNIVDKNKQVNTDKSGPDLNAMSQYSNPNRREVTMKDFTPEKTVEKEIKKEIKKEPEVKPLTTKEKFNKKFIKKDKGVGFVKRGTVTARRAENLEKNRLRAQEMAKKRIELKKKAAAEAEAKSKEDIKSSYEYDAYDMVLEYLLSTEQAATIEEANYVMMQLDEENIQEIVGSVAKLIMKTPIVKLAPALVGTGIATKMIASRMGKKSGENEIQKSTTPVTVDNEKKKKKGNFITNFINKQRDESPIGGNKRVDDTRKGSGDEKVGEKIKF